MSTPTAEERVRWVNAMTVDEHLMACRAAWLSSGLAGQDENGWKMRWLAQRLATALAEIERLRSLMESKATLIEAVADAKSWEQQCEDARSLALEQSQRAEAAEAKLAEREAWWREYADLQYQRAASGGLTGLPQGGFDRWVALHRLLGLDAAEEK